MAIGSKNPDIFVNIIEHFRSWRKENSPEIPAHGIYKSVKLFLQPVKLLEISIMLRSWNYGVLTCMDVAVILVTLGQK